MLQARLDPAGSVGDWGVLPDDYDAERFDARALDHSLALAVAWGAI